MKENKCLYCTGKPLVDRKPLMINMNPEYEYTIFINSRNYLEDSVIGSSVNHSLIGIKVEYCPMCGRSL